MKIVHSIKFTKQNIHGPEQNGICSVGLIPTCHHILSYFITIIDRYGIINAVFFIKLCYCLINTNTGCILNRRFA